MGDGRWEMSSLPAWWVSGDELGGWMIICSEVEREKRDDDVGIRPGPSVPVVTGLWEWSTTNQEIHESLQGRNVPRRCGERASKSKSKHDEPSLPLPLFGASHI